MYCPVQCCIFENRRSNMGWKSYVKKYICGSPKSLLRQKTANLALNKCQVGGFIPNELGIKYGNVRKVPEKGIFEPPTQAVLTNWGFFKTKNTAAWSGMDNLISKKNTMLFLHFYLEIGDLP